MSDRSDASRFSKRAEAFFYALARKRNLGIALGRWNHPRLGSLRVIAVNGWFGRLYVTLVCCAPDSWMERGQVRLWWYLSDQAEPFEFRHVAVRRPMSQTTTTGFLAMGKTVLGNLKWLEARSSVDEIIADQFERNIAPIGKLSDAIDDPDNELPTEGLPEGKPS
ncbi:MAG TPA: hypothetical protein VL283_04635 [Candidatus Baltobacteraceae bacterium]|nr:hypothetical protein [Candidatus Baltobacteraceae bacterium]